MTSDPSARVQLVAAPPALPGCCAICGTSVDENGFVDPDLHIEWHGSFYFCRSCVAEMAALYGFILPERAEYLASILEESEAKVAELSAKLSRLETQVDNLSFERLVSRGMLSLDSIPSSDLPPLTENVDEGEDFTTGDSEPTAEPVSDEGSDDTDADESAVIEGPDDADELTSDDTLKSIGL